MCFIVIVHDLDEQTWYAPLVDAPDAEKALDAVGDVYLNCVPVCALDVLDVEHMLNVLRGGQLDIAWQKGEGVWLK